MLRARALLPQSRLLRFGSSQTLSSSEATKPPTDPIVRGALLPHIRLLRFGSSQTLSSSEATKPPTDPIVRGALLPRLLRFGSSQTLSSSEATKPTLQQRIQWNQTVNVTIGFLFKWTVALSVSAGATMAGFLSLYQAYHTGKQTEISEKQLANSELRSFQTLFDKAVDAVVNSTVEEGVAEDKYVPREVEARMAKHLQDEPRHLFVFGPRGAGKSTSIQHLLKGRKGVVTVEVRHSLNETKEQSEKAKSETLATALLDHWGIKKGELGMHPMLFVAEVLKEAGKKLERLPVIHFRGLSIITRGLIEVQKKLTRDHKCCICVTDASNLELVGPNPLSDPGMVYQYIPEMTKEEGLKLVDGLGSPALGSSFEKYFSLLGANAASLQRYPNLGPEDLQGAIKGDVAVADMLAKEAWENYPDACKELVSVDYGVGLVSSVRANFDLRLVRKLEGRSYVWTRAAWLALKREEERREEERREEERREEERRAKLWFFQR